MDQSTLALPDALLEREHEVERVRGAVRAVGQQAGVALVIEREAGMGSHGCSRWRATGVGARSTRPECARDRARAGAPVRCRARAVRAHIGIGLHAQALVGPSAERAKGLEVALEVLAPSRARLEHARVLVDLGATLRAPGQRTAAREPLEALELAAHCGARTLERRARGELAAIGVGPRTTERAGADSLTPSELRVVEIAAAGSTNREIAQTLFVTEKTVETHLARAFRKLDISSRRRLPDVLAHAAG